MSAPFSWLWPLLAALFAIVAIVTSSNYGAAVPAAAAAVIFAAIAVGDAVRRAGVSSTLPLLPRPVSTSPIRGWLAAGRLAREDLILLVDRLERRVSRPDMPVRTPREIWVAVSLPPSEFLQYLTERLDALEGSV